MDRNCRPRYAKKLGILLLFFTILFGCLPLPQRGFYDYNKKEDLWRFPLKPPYEIVAAVREGNYWVLPLEGYSPFENGGTSYQLERIDSVGISKDLILVHSESARLSGGRRPIWMVINPKLDSILILDNRQELLEMIKETGGDGNCIFTFLPLAENFLNNLTLPDCWRD